MKPPLKRLSAGMATAIATTALAATLVPGPASAETIVRWYPYTTAGAKKRNSDANQAGPGYYCTTVTVAGRKMYALAHQGPLPVRTRAGRSRGR
ncbi:hypothetical protein GCM10009678_33780 [Actinomadura kijaniata]|uniref:Uncharacterized protein n=1 Tax=Actinomadura namibiensis TaxID=182080 RepID=A0A7W3LMY6_ACTNM|nr:hypothetical protein [Actinomadura namibiensis]MBA8951052.1 hypothetical protein [Actinomadura namibiensis]